MSLTDREKEIAEECARKADLCVDEGCLVVSRGDVIGMFSDFLSRIREEQGAVNWIKIEDSLPPVKDMWYLFGGADHGGRWVWDKFHYKLDGSVNGWRIETLIINGCTHWCSPSDPNKAAPPIDTPTAAPECKDLEMIKRMMETGTADSFISLTDEQKRMVFAVGIRESTLRKQLNESCSELVEALEESNYLLVKILLGETDLKEIKEQAHDNRTAIANHAKRMKLTQAISGEE